MTDLSLELLEPKFSVQVADRAGCSWVEGGKLTYAGAVKVADVLHCRFGWARVVLEDEVDLGNNDGLERLREVGVL